MHDKTGYDKNINEKLVYIPSDMRQFVAPEDLSDFSAIPAQLVNSPPLKAHENRRMDTANVYPYEETLHSSSGFDGSETIVDHSQWGEGVPDMPDSLKNIKSRNRKLLLKLLGGVTSITLVVILVLVFANNRIDVQQDTSTSQVATEESQDEVPVSITEEQAAEYVFAHRGTGGSEDSYQSFNSAIDQGARYIEQDVILRGGELYVSHDRLSYEEVLAQGKLRLRDVFDTYGTEVIYVVEIKTRNDKTVKAFNRLVKEYGYQDNVIVQCFKLNILRKIKKKFPGMRTLFLCDTYHGGQASVNKALGKSYVDIISVSVDDGLMTQGNCDKVHAVGKEFSAWILDSESQVDKAIAMGLDNYFTRHPRMAINRELENRE